MHEEELTALARHDKTKATEHMFNRLLWLKVHEIMQRLDPEPAPEETIEEMLTRAQETGDAEAETLMSEEGRDQVMQEARDFVDALLAGDEERTVDSYISDA